MHVFPFMQLHWKIIHLFKSARENYYAKYMKTASVRVCAGSWFYLTDFQLLIQLTYHKDLVQRNNPLSFFSELVQESAELKSSLLQAE